MTATQYEEAIAELRKEKLRPGFVSEYVDGAGSRRFTVLFIEAGDAAWEAPHELTNAQYQQAVTAWDAKGYRTACVSACDTPGGPRFEAVFVKDGLRWAARHGMTADAYRGAFNAYGNEGYRLASVSAYHDGAVLLYAAAWVGGE